VKTKRSRAAEDDRTAADAECGEAQKGCHAAARGGATGLTSASGPCNRTSRRRGKTFYLACLSGSLHQSRPASVPVQVPFSTAIRP
jgi:hypothetical protein